jgi:hypothetical protein
MMIVRLRLCIKIHVRATGIAVAALTGRCNNLLCAIAASPAVCHSPARQQRYDIRSVQLHPLQNTTPWLKPF